MSAAAPSAAGEISLYAQSDDMSLTAAGTYPTEGAQSLTRTVTQSLATELGLGPSRAFSLSAYQRASLNAVAKRSFDIAFAFAVIFLALPAMLLLMAAIAVSSPGPVFFRQTRVGKNGKQFQCLKFRTMVVNAEEILDRNPELKQAFAAGWKLPNDPRITNIGRILRKTSLDELPQIINILRGDMSVVGPRPVQSQELASHYGIHADTVLSVRPGLTGLWQVSGRSNTSYAFRVAMDLEYIARRSFWLDSAIVLRTITTVCKADGAY